MEWVSVDERLPEENVLVIVADWCNYDLGIGRLEPIGGGHYQWVVGEIDGVIYLHGNSFKRISHWMPLPEPPQETTNDTK